MYSKRGYPADQAILPLPSQGIFCRQENNPETEDPPVPADSCPFAKNHSDIQTGASLSVPQILNG